MEAMTIEERAKNAATNYGYAVAGGCLERGMISESFEQGYINGATEQQEIDIQNAVEYLCGECTSKCEHICMMCNRKNELIKAMKGE